MWPSGTWGGTTLWFIRDYQIKSMLHRFLRNLLEGLKRVRVRELRELRVRELPIRELRVRELRH